MRILALGFVAELLPRAAGAATEIASLACDMWVRIFETMTLQARVKIPAP